MEGWCHSFSRLKSTGGGSNSWKRKGKKREKKKLPLTVNSYSLSLEPKREIEEQKERGGRKKEIHIAAVLTG